MPALASTRRTFKLAAFAAMVLLIGLVLIAIRGATLVGRSNSVQAGIQHLAQAIELYRNDHNSYPRSLEALVSGSTPAMKDWLERNQILSDRFGNRYQFSLTTNGFTVAVTSPRSWLAGKDRVEKHFIPGEALR